MKIALVFGSNHARTWRLGYAIPISTGLWGVDITTAFKVFRESKVYSRMCCSRDMRPRGAFGD